jgi:serine/threonine protein kinase/Tol biopolymer transport system component
MALNSGDRVGSYEIVGLLGAGGMGEVYRARDTRLHRDVAIKALPSEFAQDTARLARFEREARLLASLNHPNIATIHGIEETAGSILLVLERVEGETLAARLAAGPLPMEEAISVCSLVARGLEAAHEADVIHRDLKPGNVMVRPDGSVKVLDFGLARSGNSPDASRDQSHSPTLTAASQQGVILGTAAYMSPEQARGKPLDKRTDIFSFGCMLYECLTGRQAFGGDTASDTLAAILKSEPALNALPPETPARIRVLLRRCLEKDPARRLHDIADARLELEDASEFPDLPPTAPARTSPGSRIVWGAVGLLAGALGYFLAGHVFRPSPPNPAPHAPLRASLTLPPGASLRTGPYQPSIAFSPDGRRLVLGVRDGGTRLYVRALDRAETAPIAGTEWGYAPFFSPDGEWLAFFTGRELKKVALAGGTPLVVCEVSPVTMGGAWTPDGWIYITIANGGLLRVRSSGGTPEPFTTPDRKAGERAHVWPQMLPGGSQLLVVVRAGKDFQDFERSNLAVLDIATRKLRVVLQGVSFGRFAPPGHLIFARGGSVLAVPCDPRTFEPSGPHFALPEKIVFGEGARVPFLASAAGVLGYAAGEPEKLAEGTLVWVDRAGREEALPLEPGSFNAPIFSPDGKTLAIVVQQGSRQSIFTYDLQRSVLSPLLPEAGRAFSQTWTPDSRRIVFASFDEGFPRLYWKAADGGGSPEPLSQGEFPEFPSSVSPDGRTLAYAMVSTTPEKTDMWLLDLGGKRGRRVWFETPFKEYGPLFSPDGGLIAYTAEESGRKPEVYVRPYPGPGGRIKISGGDGGSEPLWAPDGSELFYRSESEDLMSARIVRSPALAASAPRFVLKAQPYLSGYGEDTPHQYAISPDGKRFLFIKPVERKRQAITQVELVTDWPSLFGRPSGEKP